MGSQVTWGSATLRRVDMLRAFLVCVCPTKTSDTRRPQPAAGDISIRGKESARLYYDSRFAGPRQSRPILCEYAQKPRPWPLKPIYPTRPQHTSLPQRRAAFHPSAMGIRPRCPLFSWPFGQSARGPTLAGFVILYHTKPLDARFFVDFNFLVSMTIRNNKHAKQETNSEHIAPQRIQLQNIFENSGNFRLQIPKICVKNNEKIESASMKPALRRVSSLSFLYVRM